MAGPYAVPPGHSNVVGHGLAAVLAPRGSLRWAPRDVLAGTAGGYCGSLGATEPETDFPLFLEWVREDKFPLGKLVTDRYSLDQVEQARVALEEGQILGRAIIGI
jgi:Zn-dependent alcohol dehydrogenase